MGFIKSGIILAAAAYFMKRRQSSKSEGRSQSLGQKGSSKSSLNMDDASGASRNSRATAGAENIAREF